MDKVKLTEQACNAARAKISGFSDQYYKGLITYRQFIDVQCDIMQYLAKELLDINFVF